MIIIEKSNAIAHADNDCSLVYKSGSKFKIKHLAKGQEFVCPEEHAYIFDKAEKKLGEGEHHTPPKGYPTSRDDYAVPDYYIFPIDRKHIHAAISYFGKHSWQVGENKKEAAKRILSRAEKYGIDVGKDSDVYRAAH